MNIEPKGNYEEPTVDGVLDDVERLMRKNYNMTRFGFMTGHAALAHGDSYEIKDRLAAEEAVAAVMHSLTEFALNHMRERFTNEDVRLENRAIIRERAPAWPRGCREAVISAQQVG